MKILFVDLQYDYGQKGRGLNQIGENGFRAEFLRLGHRVETFYYDDFLDKRDTLQVELLAKAEASEPDLIYFILFGDQFEIETLRKLGEKSKTINWFGDDQWRFESFTKKYAPYFSYCITTDPFSVSKYLAIGCNVILSQWAALSDEMLPEPTSYELDVSFVGGFHSVRKWFVDELGSAGIRVHTFGHGWPNGAVSLNEMLRIFTTSKINLNLSNSVNFDLRYLTHGLKNPITALRSQKSLSQMKARNFEIPYSGGFQLAEYVPFLESYLDIGREVICYRDTEDAIRWIRYFLANEPEREHIRKAGHLRARKEHSYFNRHQKIFEQIS